MKIIAFAAAAGLAAAANAQVVTGYDFDNALESGAGNWFHVYGGTTTGDGTVATEFGTVGRVDLTGGAAGTLNDGDTNSGAPNAHILSTAGGNNPALTVYLDGSYFVDTITIWDREDGNTIPGNIAGFDVTINGNTQTFVGAVANNDIVVNLAGSGLENLGTGSVTVDNFVLAGNNGWFTTFSMNEVTVTGRPVPTPGALALIGLGGLAAARRRR